MEIIYLLIVLVIGAISTFVIINYLKQNKQIVDISNFEDAIKNLREEVKGYKEKVIEDKGKTDQLAKDMRTSISDVNRIAENLKTTLVSGGSQQQGAWGELLLKNILTLLVLEKGKSITYRKFLKMMRVKIKNLT